VERNQGRRQDGLLGRARNFAQALAFVGREGGDEDEATTFLASVAAFEINAPAYE
jgi:hypothetical protein